MWNRILTVRFWVTELSKRKLNTICLASLAVPSRPREFPDTYLRVMRTPPTTFSMRESDIKVLIFIKTVLKFIKMSRKSVRIHSDKNTYLWIRKNQNEWKLKSKTARKQDGPRDFSAKVLQLKLRQNRYESLEPIELWVGKQPISQFVVWKTQNSK